MTCVRRRTTTAGEFTAYGGLYQRARGIAHARISELTRNDQRVALHTWTLYHGWRSIDVGSHRFLFAFLTMGLISPANGESMPQGEIAPAPEELMTPGGATTEFLQQAAAQRVDEIYVDFDHGVLPGGTAGVVMFSYGESVAACEDIDYEPFLSRAEKRARFHYDLPESRHASQKAPFQVIRREWWCVTNPNLVAVHIYFEG